MKVMSKRGSWRMAVAVAEQGCRCGAGPPPPPSACVAQRGGLLSWAPGRLRRLPRQKACA